MSNRSNEEPSMTREELRERAIDVMEDAYESAWHGEEFIRVTLTAILDGLGVAGFPVLGPVVTDEMHRAAKQLRDADREKGKPTLWGSVFTAMAAVGDLTRKPK